MQTPLSPDATFSTAAEIWLESRNFRDGKSRSRYIANTTMKSYQQYVHSLGRFFSEIPLQQIHIGHLREYQELRSAGELGVEPEQVLARLAKQLKTTVERLRTEPGHAIEVQRKLEAAKVEVSSNKINQEIGTLIRIMKRANCWTAQLTDAYEGLQREEADIPRAMTPAEQEYFLDIAGSRSEWRFIYCYSLVSLRTTLTNWEMRGLRLGDINLASGIIYVQAAHAKNKYRVRTVPLAPDALWGAQQIVERARELGSGQPQHYAMPFRVARGFFDPTRPMSNSGVKKPWDALRRAAGVPWLRVHDLRHTAITRLAEAGTPIPVVMSMAGHISRRMMQHYTQISEQAQRTAVMAAYQQTFYQASGAKRPPMRDMQAAKNSLDSHIANGIKTPPC